MLATAVRPVTHEDKHNASNSSKAGDTRPSVLCGSTDYSPVGLQGGSKKLILSEYVNKTENTGES